jgi:hypothetical protein
MTQQAGTETLPLARPMRLPRRAGAVLLILAALAAIVPPLLVADIPPLLDYPNHLARSYIVQNLAGDPLLQRWYQLHWHLVPDLGHDLVMLLLTPWMPVTVAGRVLIGLTQLLTLGGLFWLHRVLWGGWSWWPIAGVPFLWHGGLTAGFTSFSLALGAALPALALWLVLARRPLALRIAVAVAIGMILFVLHVLALAVFGLTVAGAELVAALQAPAAERSGRLGRSLLVLAACALLPAALYLNGPSPPADAILFGPWTWTARLRGLQMPLMGADREVRLLLTGVLGVLAAVLLLTRSVRIHPALLPGIAVLMTLFLALPGTLVDNGLVPERIPIALAFLAIAASAPDERWTPLKTVACATVVACGTLQAVSVGRAWGEAQHWIGGLQAALRQTPPGQRLLIAVPWHKPEFRRLYVEGRRLYPGWYYQLADFPALMHMGSLAVMRGDFVPLLFSHPQKQILSFTPEVEALGHPQGNPEGIDEVLRPDAVAGGPLLSAPFDSYDYVLLIYAEMLSPGQRARLSRLNPVYDDGSILMLRNASTRADEPGRVAGMQR